MKAAELFAGILFLCIGCFSFVSGLLNFDWFFKSVNAALFVKWFGRNGARCLYIFIGILVIVMGILMLSGKMD